MTLNVPNDSNMVELDLHDHVVVVTGHGKQHMTVAQFTELVARGDTVDKVMLKVDLDCQNLADDEPIE